MPFGIIGRTCPGMRQVVGFGDRSTGRGTCRGEFRARHCNQWGLYGVCVRQRRDAALFPNYFGPTCYNVRIVIRCGLEPRHFDLLAWKGNSAATRGRLSGISSSRALLLARPELHESLVLIRRKCLLTEPRGNNACSGLQLTLSTKKRRTGSQKIHSCNIARQGASNAISMPLIWTQNINIEPNNKPQLCLQIFKNWSSVYHFSVTV